MAFDHIASHQRRMTGTQLWRQPQLGAHGIVAAVVDLYGKAIGLQMINPVLAAAAAGVFPDLNRDA